jgi:DNA end-binding protein Ku
MAARAMASATISFGLVSIPVKVYTSGESSTGVSFNLLHKTCGSRIKLQYFCPKDEEVVERAEMTKGYEFAKGQYVMFDKEELKALEQEATETIEITEFLPTTKVDPIYFEKAYYLGPDKAGTRAYKLLVQALEKSGRSALAKYAARGKQYLVLMRPVKDTLVMQQLRYADEVKSLSEVPIGDAEVKPAELKLALQIVEQGEANEFKPEEYEDEVRNRILGLVRRKMEGQEITVQPAEQPKAQVIDLMEALKASLSGKAVGRRPAKHATRLTAVPKTASASATRKANKKAKSS